MNERLETTGDKAGSVLSHSPKPFRAVIASLLGSGLGHVYAGKLRRGIVLYGIGVIVLALMTAAIAYVPFEGINVAVALCLFVLFRLCCATDAFRSARLYRGTSRRAYQKWWCYLMVWLFGFTLLAGYYRVITPLWMQNYCMVGLGMADTLLPSDRFFVEKRSLFAREIRRGDVVAYLSDLPERTIYVQRVIGLPGDTIGFKNATLYRDGKPVDEPYVKTDELDSVSSLDLSYVAPIVVPEGELYMAGDNRGGSYDSRVTGPVAIENIVGHVMSIYWSNVPREEDSSDSVVKIRWNRIGTRVIDGAK